MKRIRCTRKTSYSRGGGRIQEFAVDELYDVGKSEGKVPYDIAVQMIQNRTAVACEHEKLVKEDLVEENKSTNPVDENKSDDTSENEDGQSEGSSEESDENEPSLDDMDKAELIAYAEDKNIEVNKSLGKDRLRESIIAAEESNHE